jgi:hypothetical protein
VLVGLKLVERALDRGVLGGGVLQFEDGQRQTIDEDDDIGPAPNAMWTARTPEPRPSLTRTVSRRPRSENVGTGGLASIRRVCDVPGVAWPWRSTATTRQRRTREGPQPWEPTPSRAPDPRAFRGLVFFEGRATAPLSDARTRVRARGATPSGTNFRVRLAAAAATLHFMAGAASPPKIE